MEDGNTAQRTAEPLAVVLLKLGVDRLEEGAHEGKLPRGTSNGALVLDVADCSEARVKSARALSRSGVHGCLGQGFRTYTDRKEHT